MKRQVLPLLLAFLTAVNVQQVYACSCAATPSPRQALREATAVFTGEVISKEVFEVKDEYGTQPIVRVTFAISRIWKGVKGAEIIVHTSGWSPSCGFSFEQGKKYLVYAYPDRWKLNVLETGICNRTKELNGAARDLRAIGRGSEPK